MAGIQTAIVGVGSIRGHTHSPLGISMGDLLVSEHRCKDCRKENRQGPVLNVVEGVPGPRCYNHAQKWRRRQREKASEQRRVKTYGLAPGDYERLLEAQQGRCGWCGRSRRKSGRAFAVDHDHSCCPGKTSCGDCVRGLLCWSCNKHFQHLADDPDLVDRGAEYLRNPPAKKVPIQLSLPQVLSSPTLSL